MIDFGHGRIRIGLDDATGSIVSVVDTVTGRALFHARSDQDRLGRLFRVIAPIERWSSHFADSRTAGRPRFDRSRDRLIVRFDDLRSETGPLGVSAEIELRAGGPSEILLTLRLESRRSEGPVTDVLFPWLGGWQGSADSEITLGGSRAIRADYFPVNRGMTFSRWHQREYWTYPIDLYVPWLDLAGREGAVGIVSYQRDARNLGGFLENLAGYREGRDLSAGFNHYLELRHGERWQSPPIGISLHAGDWHDTADRYAAWVDTWFRPPPTPRWARESIGFQNVLFRGFDGTPIRALDTIPAVAAAGVASGVPHLCVWDYVLLGEYGKLHDVPQHGFLEGERATLRAALLEAQSLGARLSSLQNYRLVKPTSTLFHDVGEREVCRRYDGSPFVEEYSGSLAHALVITTHVGPMVHPIDARVSSVRRRALQLIGDSLDLGFDSHFYDQPFEQWPSYHRDRGADGPDGAHAATVSLLGEVRDLIAARSPEGIVIGEYCDVFGAQAVDLWMSWYTEFDDLRRSVYSIPQTMQSWVVDRDEAAAVRAFTIGAQLCLTTEGGESHLGEHPAFAASVARLAALRARAERVWSGRYRDAEGYQIEAIGPVVAGSFVGPKGRAIVIGSPGASGAAKLRLDDDKAPTSSAHLLRLDGRTDAVSGATLELELERNEVAVWYP